jgi:alanine dehydrogenase
MIIGVPRESSRNEHRVGLTPDAAGHLVGMGQTVVVEKDAGLDARFHDDEYQKAGATIVYSAEEAYKRADVVMRIGPMSAADVEMLKPGSTVCGFHHLAVAPREVLNGLIDRRITAIAYELIQDEAGNRPILTPFSEMAGMLAVHLAAHHLCTDAGGKGTLLGNVPGITPPMVVILGAGMAGQTAASQARAAGARVVVLDSDMNKLREVSTRCHGQVSTVNVALVPMEKYVAAADVLIGAVLIPGSRAPILVTRDMVKAMPRGSVIIDLSIDQGGCVETSRPTTLDHPTFVTDDVVHYCVPNMTSSVSRTASKALARAVLPQLDLLAELGVKEAVASDPTLASGVAMYEGTITNPEIADARGFDASSLDALVEGAGV